MKRVLIIYTGGTIGMTRTENGYAPRAGYFRAALDAIPDLRAPEMPEWEFYELSPLLDSSNMTVREWNCIAELIAQKYDMRYSDLKELNPEIETELFVGQEVLISRSVPFLGVQVTKTVTETEDIPYEIEQVTDNSYNEGFTKVSVKGQTGEKEVTSQITYVDGVETERIVLDSRVVKEPVTQKVIVGGNKPLSYIPTSGGTNNGGFIWPVGGNGGYVSCRIWG